MTISTKAESGPSIASTRFRTVLSELVADFPNNKTCRAIDAGGFTLARYHRFLLMIFHQVFRGPHSFAMAATQASFAQASLRDYLLRHADEEKSHWRWILNDLEATGYGGPDPRTTLPPVACASFVAWNEWCAHQGPHWRLGNAAYLESLGASYGKNYALSICEQLQLEEAQASFLFGHGDTDVGHTEEILQELQGADLSESEWECVGLAAEGSARLYKQMYEDVAT